MYIFLIICFVIAAICVIATIDQEKKKSALKKEAVQLKLADPYTMSSGLHPHTDAINLEYEPACMRFAVSADRQTAYLRSGLKNPSVAVPFSSIIDCQIKKDCVPINNLGRAILGGILAGGAGAVAAGNTGKQYREGCTLVIWLKKPHQPRFEYELLSGRVGYTRSQYKEAMKFAEDVKATIKAVRASAKN